MTETALALMRLPLRNVRRGWRQSLTSLISILSAFSAVALFGGFVRDASSTVGASYQHLAMLGDLLVEGPGVSSSPELLGRSRISPEAQDVIDSFLAEHANEVRTSARFLHLSGTIGAGAVDLVFLGYGYDLAEGALLRGPALAWNNLGGLPLQESQDPNAIAVGIRLGAALGCVASASADAFLPEGGFKPGARPLACTAPTMRLEGTDVHGQVTRMEVRTAGVVDAGLRTLETRLVVMPLALAQTLENTQDVSMYSVALWEPSGAEALRDALMERAARAGVSLSVVRWEEHPFFGDFYRRTQAVLSIYERFLFGVVATVGAMSVANTVSRTVLERTKEIGTLRSLGFTPRHLLGLFAMEGALLGVLACALGVIFTVVAALAFNAADLHYPPGLASFPVSLRIRLIPEFYLELTALMAAVSAVAATIPAARATRMRVADALRET